MPRFANLSSGQLEMIRKFIEEAESVQERLGRFANFRKRDFNSHMPMSLDGHRRMLKVYEPMRPSLGGGHLLSAHQLVALLNEGEHPNSRQQG